MITGEKQLRELYPNLDEKQYQPAGIDLTLNKICELEHTNGSIYGLFKNTKVLPKLVDCKTSDVQVGGALKTVYILRPHIPYIAITNEKIKISKHAGQFYLPRSSELSAGIDVRTAFGDPGFYGHLRFLIINHTDEIFVLEKGVRFAQLVDMLADNVDKEYDGDYNEK